MFSLDEPHQPLLSVPPSPSSAHAGPFSPPSTTRSQMIDVAKSFAPHNDLRLPFSINLNLTPMIRLLFLYWSLQVLYLDVTTYPPHNLYIYMGYLTHWGHVLSIFYLACSLACSVWPYAVRQPSQSTGRKNVGNESESTSAVGSVSESAITASDRDLRVSAMVKWTWLLYSTVAPLEICITLLYWSAVTDGNPQGYVSVMEHGGVCILVLLDGAAVGTVPVRIKQAFCLVAVCACYLTWSGINYAMGIGNGEWGPTYGDDDALYPVLNWGEDGRKLAGWLSAFCITILAPGVFWAVWMLSLFGGWKHQRRMTSAEDDEEGLKHDSDHHRFDGEETRCCCCCSWCCCLHCHWDGSRRPLFQGAPEQQTISRAALDGEPFGYRTLEEEQDALC